jgi:uncharacterized protein
MSNIKLKEFALITGASSGIGEEFATIIAEKGINVLLIARRVDKLTEVASKLSTRYNIEAKILPLDLTKADSATIAYNYCKENNLQVKYLINNAGFGITGNFSEIELPVETSMIDLNVRSLVEFTKLFGAEMINQRFGKILNVSSVGAYLPGPQWAVYFATKAFVQSYSQAIASELKPYGISVTTLCPGPTKSEFGEISGASKLSSFNMNLATSHQVAKYGIKAMMKGKRVAVHGLSNKLLTRVLVPLIPNWILLRAMEIISR